ncbi:MAG: indolepyruvate oxidoreductase subunit beta family protein [Burkholderiaceae bacterium]
MSGAAGTPAGIGPAGDVATDRSARIAIAIVAMGGQGGGVLSDWIVALAESNGWLAQNTSVPGVAQRTGATVYYIELFDASRAQGLAPVLALMPTSGDVDLVVAAELMEAGRAIQRGFVTPDRTTLIASSHRAYATVEKIVPGDGRADAAGVHEAARVAARRYLVDDMAALAERHGSVISASLFGAIAASGALPFPREAFEAAIRAGGVGVEASLAAFGAGFLAADRPPSAAGEEPGDAAGNRPGLPPPRDDDSLHARVRAGLPESVHALAALGVDRQREYLDEAYADEYLQRLVRVAGSQPTCRRKRPMRSWPRSRAGSPSG